MTDKTINEAITALEQFYNKQCRGKSIEYVYGFMDAMAVIRSFTGQPGQGVSAE